MTGFTHPEIGLTASYSSSLEQLSLEHRERCRKALFNFSQDPSNKGNQFGPIQGVNSSRLFKIRAAHDVRVIIAKEGNLHYAVLAGRRDQIYKRAKRGRFVIDQVNETIAFHEPLIPEALRPEPETTGRMAREPTVHSSRGLLSHWSSAELEAAGLTEAEITTIRSLESTERLLELLVERLRDRLGGVEADEVGLPARALRGCERDGRHGRHGPGNGAKTF